MLTFAGAVFFLLITPGPGVLSIAGVGAAYGYRAGARYFLGLLIGTNLVALAVVSGLAAALLAVPGLRLVLTAASALYLLYLAAKIALAGAQIGFSAARAAPGVAAGIGLQLINPKAYVVNTLLFSGFPFAGFSLSTETLIKFALINAVWVPIHVLWLALGVTLKKLALTPQAQRMINLAMAAALLTVVALALWSAWTGAAS